MGTIDSNNIALTNSKRNSSNSGGGAVLWKALQGVILILLLFNLKKTNNNSNTCPPAASPIRHQPSASTSPSSNLRSKSESTRRTSSSSFYTTPVSPRVPAQGIDTVLATSRTNPPFHFFAYPRTIDLVTANLITTGIYEQDSTTALIDAIVCTSNNNNNNNNDNKKPNYLTLDLGANIGFHSLHMAACGARVIALEASPDTAWLLTSSARLNQFDDDALTVIPRGASNTTSVGRLSRHADSPGMTSFIDQPQAVFDKMEAPLQGTALDVDIPMVRAQDVLHDLLGTTTTSDTQQQASNYQLRLVKMDGRIWIPSIAGAGSQKPISFWVHNVGIFPSIAWRCGDRTGIAPDLYLESGVSIFGIWF